MDKIYVSDANIFIDMHRVGMIDCIFTLPCTIHTTDFVFRELLDDALRTKLFDYEKAGKLYIKRFSADEIQDLSLFRVEERARLSFPDMSIWYYAYKENGMIITGDKALRRKAEKDDIEVHGILYLWDLLVVNGIVDSFSASRRLMHLCSFNKRIPKNECQKLINSWRVEEISLDNFEII